MTAPIAVTATESIPLQPAQQAGAPPSRNTGKGSGRSSAPGYEFLGHQVLGHHVLEHQSPEEQFSGLLREAQSKGDAAAAHQASVARASVPGNIATTEAGGLRANLPSPLNAEALPAEAATTSAKNPTPGSSGKTTSRELGPSPARKNPGTRHAPKAEPENAGVAQASTLPSFLWIENKPAANLPLPLRSSTAVLAAANTLSGGPALSSTMENLRPAASGASPVASKGAEQASAESDKAARGAIQHSAAQGSAGQTGVASSSPDQNIADQQAQRSAEPLPTAPATAAASKAGAQPHSETTATGGATGDAQASSQAGSQMNATSTKDATGQKDKIPGAGSAAEAASARHDSASVSGQPGTAQRASTAQVHETASGPSRSSLPPAQSLGPPSEQPPAHPASALTAANASSRTAMAGVSLSGVNPHALLDSAAGAPGASRDALWQLSPNRVEAGFSNAQNSWISVVAQRQEGHLTAVLESGSLPGKEALQSLLPQLAHHLAERQTPVSQLGVSVRQPFSPGGSMSDSGSGYGQGQQSTSSPGPGAQLRQPAAVRIGGMEGMEAIPGHTVVSGSSLVPGRRISLRV